MRAGVPPLRSADWTTDNEQHRLLALCRL